MPKKGENIYKRKDGRWEGRYKCGFDKNGRTKYKSVYSQSYKDCKEKLNYAKNTQDKYKADIKVSLTVNELFDDWLKNIVVKVKQSTANTYKLIIDNHLVPVIGCMPVYEVTASFLNQLISDKLNSGRIDGKGPLSAKTVQNIIGVLKSVFKYAEKIYGIKNPTSFITIPKVEHKEIEVLTEQEIKSIAKYCKNNPDYFSVAYDLCLSTGIRIGELCALQCEDIDFENGILIIRKTIQRIKNDNLSESGKTKVIIDSPKTTNSTRKIPLPDELLTKLKGSIGAKKGSDFIFSYNNKKPLDVRTMQKKFTSVLKKCGIRKVKFHILRHTFATKWANSNFDIKGLSEILGHSNVNVTLSLYVHSSFEMKRKHINELYAA